MKIIVSKDYIVEHDKTNLLMIHNQRRDEKFIKRFRN
jgi:hypothetical protein